VVAAFLATGSVDVAVIVAGAAVVVAAITMSLTRG
jgi:hypothetical protein